MIRVLPLLAVLSLARPAAADGTRADALVADAVSLYELGRFERAIVVLEQAYALEPRSDLLYMLGQCHRHLRHYERAIWYYRAFLRHDPNNISRVPVEKLIEEMTQALRTTAKEPKARADHPAPPPPEPWYQDRLGWTLSGSGLVAAGIGLALWSHASSLRSEARATADEADAAALLDSADSYRLWGGGLMVAGGVGLALGVTAFILPLSSRTDRATVSVLPTATGLVLGGSF